MDNILLIHIGMPKTGSTALQTFLYKNRDNLEKFGWRYPDLEKELPETMGMRASRERNGYFLLDDVRKINVSSEAWNQKWMCILNHLKNWNVILSSEMFYFKGVLLPFLEDVMKRWSNVRVVVYLRRQDRWIESGWNQLVKFAFKESCCRTFEKYLKQYEEIIEEDCCHYKLKMDQIAQIVGKENVIVKVYEKQQFCGEDHTIESDFLSILKIAPDWSEWKRCGRENDGLRGNYVELKRVINTVLTDAWTDDNWWITGIVKELSHRFNQGGGQEGYLSVKERENILSEFAIDNEQVAREYLGREDGILFYDKTMDYSMGNVHSCTPFEEDLIRLFYTAISRVNSRAEWLQTEVEQARKRGDVFAGKLLLQAANERELLFFGAGQRCREVLARINLKIVQIVDNDERKSGSIVNGIEVVHPKDIEDWSKYYVIVTCAETEEIERQIQKLGLKKERDYALAREYFGYDS